MTNEAKYLEKAQEAMGKREWDYAILLLSEVCRNHLEDLEARRLLREAERRRSAEGRNWLGQILAHVPKILWQFDLLMVLQKEAYEKAVQAAEKILEHFPSDVKTLRLLSRAFLKLNLTEEAILALEEAHQVKKKDIPILKELAKLYLVIKNLEKARGTYERILTIAPLEAEATRALKDMDALETIERGGLGEKKGLG